MPCSKERQNGKKKTTATESRNCALWVQESNTRNESPRCRGIRPNAKLDVGEVVPETEVGQRQYYSALTEATRKRKPKRPMTCARLRGRERADLQRKLKAEGLCFGLYIDCV